MMILMVLQVVIWTMLAGAVVATTYKIVKENF